MIKLPHSIELLVRQVAAQSATDPRTWLEEMLMKEIKKRVSKDAIELAKSKGRKHRAASRRDTSRL